MKLEKNTSFSHFKILSAIGSGGMGEVYLAQDTKLDRKVAIKFLNEKYSQDAEKLKRFVQEAKTTSALNHRCILTVFEIDEFDNTHYIATEYIEGETLRDRLSKKDPLSLNRILKIGIQTAEALFAAHEAGIVHRDIKPENIMIRKDGYVKVLDFGLAKLTEKNNPKDISLEGETKALVETDPGSVMGTASYMSPEQASGKEVDQRTDIWSLGVVLYEMLAGKVPFQGKTVSHTIVEIIEKEPHLIEDIPNALQRIVRKTLAKNREMRYQSAKDLFIDLKNLKRELDLAGELKRSVTPDKEQTETENQIYTADPAHETDSADPASTRTVTSESSLEYAVNQAKSHRAITFTILGVLIIATAALSYFYLYSTPTAPLTDKDVILITDFDNKTGEEIFDGTLKQGLTMALQQSPFLSIFPDAQAHATLKLMKRDPDEKITKELGREISQRKGLKAFITGTLTKLGSVYLLGLEAINTETGETIASVQAQADADDQKNVLDAMSKAATEMRGKLGESLSEIEKFDKPLVDATTSSLEALKAFTMARESNGKGDPASTIGHCQRAIEIDPDFTSAYNLLSVAYSNYSQFELAREASNKAFEMREGLSEREKLIVADMYYTSVTNELDKSIKIRKLMKTTFPRWSTNALGHEYREIGEDEKALTEALIAVKRAPDEIFSYNGLAFTYLLLNRYAEAKETVEKAFQKKFDTGLERGILYQIAFIKGDEKEMQRQVKAMKGKPGEDNVPQWQASVASYRGQWKKYQEFYRQAVTLAERNDNKGSQSLRLSQGALTASVFGKCSQIRSLTEESLGLARNRYTISNVALALARCGDISKVESLINELEEKYPKATLGNGLWLPTIKAMIEIKKGKAKEAVQLLETAKRYERSFRAEFWPQYLRGEAYLALNENEKAKAEFQNILDHRGRAPYSPHYPLAQLGKARATKDKKEYEKFFEMWKDADKDLPALISAKKEYAALN